MADEITPSDMMGAMKKKKSASGYDSDLVKSLTTTGQAATYRNDRATPAVSPSPSPDTRNMEQISNDAINPRNRKGNY